ELPSSRLPSVCPGRKPPRSASSVRLAGNYATHQMACMAAARARRIPAWLSLRVRTRRSHDGRMTLTLRSPALESGTPIPARFDHERGDRSPPLLWDGVPEGTAGLVLLVDDPDAPVKGSFVHWVLCNLDPARQGIAEGEAPAEATAGANGFGRSGYLGPAPPPGDAPHHYIFRLLALDEPASLKGRPSYKDVEAAVTGHTLGEARLVGPTSDSPDTPAAGSRRPGRLRIRSEPAGHGKR